MPANKFDPKQQATLTFLKNMPHEIDKIKAELSKKRNSIEPDKWFHKKRV